MYEHGGTEKPTKNGGENMETINWFNKITQLMAANGETVMDIVAACPDWGNDGYLEEFDPDYGVVEGCPFCVWTHNRIYFPACYDGSEWVVSISRNPDGKPVEHIGG